MILCPVQTSAAFALHFRFDIRHCMYVYGTHNAQRTMGNTPKRVAHRDLLALTPAFVGDSGGCGGGGGAGRTQQHPRVLDKTGTSVNQWPSVRHFLPLTLAPRDKPKPNYH
jgi:hypothetical protein